MSEQLRVSKAGGSTIAQGERFIHMYEQTNDCPDILIVSAPGEDPENGHDGRLTDTLMRIDHRAITPRNLESVMGRLADFVVRLDPSCTNLELSRLLNEVPRDLERWVSQGAPPEAFGEHITARMIAAQTGRTFIDARDVIQFGPDGRLNRSATWANARREFTPGAQYVMGGYLGRTSAGGTGVFDRGGSDTTAAVVAEAIGLNNFDMWSDPAGFLSGPPETVPNALLIPEASIAEVSEAALSGCDLVQQEALRVARRGHIAISLRSLWHNNGEPGTIIVPERNANPPVVNVTGGEGFSLLSVREMDMDSQVGRTVPVFQELESSGIPYRHITTGANDIGIVIQNRYLNSLPYKMRENGIGGMEATVRSIGLLTIVGEGFATNSSVGIGIHGRASLALEEANIPVLGMTSSPGTPSATYLIDAPNEHVEPSIRAVHRTLFE